MLMEVIVETGGVVKLERGVVRADAVENKLQTL